MEELDSVIIRASQRLGYTSVRPMQLQAIRSFMQGNDVFISLPTGSGKSLCYSVLPYAFDELLNREGSIVVVVSPLIALMKDQVLALSAKGLSAVCIAGLETESTLTSEVQDGRFQVVFFSPELLISCLKWRQMLASSIYQTNLIAIAIDEAHCVTKWGDFFRREFSNLGEVRSLVPYHVKMMALTATATVDTRRRICLILGMREPSVIATSPDKTNLCYWVKEGVSVHDFVTPLVAKLKVQRSKLPRVMIFCRRIEDCSILYRLFLMHLKKEFTEPIGAPNVSKFRLVDMYTSVTDKEVQDSIIASFCKIDSSLRVLICTIAFGMGLDCHDVSQIIHWGPASNLEAYMQECGRAGRSGNASSALLYVRHRDLSSPNISKDMKDYCKSEDTCRRHLLAIYFEMDFSAIKPRNCACCDVCARNCACSNCLCSTFPVELYH